MAPTAALKIQSIDQPEVLNNKSPKRTFGDFVSATVRLSCNRALLQVKARSMKDP